MKICYVETRFHKDSLALIDQANGIIDEYEGMGFELTLRQLYYQLVARDIIANSQKEYKRIGSIINDGRLGGLIDWNRLVDLTRELRGRNHWNSPEEIIAAVSNQYAINLWEGQEFHVEVWVEKDALRNVVERACVALDVAFFACRGYTSQSEMWAAAMRLIRKSEEGQKCVIIHIGDHDPSGIDMTRDIQDRLRMFHCDAEVKRIALNMPQVEEFKPPPNPAKTTDSRCHSYIGRFGTSSWELDALDPETLMKIIQGNIRQHLNQDLFDEQKELQSIERNRIGVVSDNWQQVCSNLDI